jgi:cytidyltransferase-related domain
MSNSTSKILVIGDIMLDRYVIGNVNRFCPSSYVPVLKEYEQQIYLGGAGNVFMNIHSMENICDLCGVIGNDNNGRIIQKQLREIGNDMNLIYCKDSYKTTTKNYFYADNNQLLLRVDEEEQLLMSEREYDDIMLRIKSNITKYKVFVISDYNKNFMTEEFITKIIKLCNENNIKVIVDSKKKNPKLFTGSYLIKPNKYELENFFCVHIKTTDEIIEYAKKLKNIIQCSKVIVTNAGDGIVLINDDEAPYVEKAAECNVIDSNGAGDLFFSVIAYYIYKEKDIYESIFQAKNLASQTCSNLGTFHKIDSIMNITLKAKKTIDENDIHKLVDIYRKENKKIVFANGCFDIIHSGHVDLLKQAKSNGNVLIVGLNSDESIHSIKGSDKPIISEDYRLNVLQSIRYVDHVVIFHDKDPRNLINIIHPDVVIKGEDYKEKTIIESEIIEKYGGKLIILDNKFNISTKQIIERIRGNL